MRSGMVAVLRAHARVDIFGRLSYFCTLWYIYWFDMFCTFYKQYILSSRTIIWHFLRSLPIPIPSKPKDKLSQTGSFVRVLWVGYQSAFSYRFCFYRLVISQTFSYRLFCPLLGHLFVKFRFLPPRIY